MSTATPAYTVKCQTCGEFANPETGRIRHRIIDDPPTIDELEAWTLDLDMPRATDGCEPVEPDGICEHGHRAWPRALGLV